MNFFNKRIQETKEQPGFLVNSPLSTDPIFILHNPEFLKDYFAKEIECTIKES